MKLKHIFSIFAIIATFASCDFLDQTSPNDIDADTAFQTAANAENALLGLYSSLQNPGYYGGYFPLIVDALGDNCTTGGFDNPFLDELGAKIVTPSNILVEDLWLNMYRSIANCNRLLEALPGIKDLDGTRRQQIEGQARVIRAMAHLDLLRCFGYHWDGGSQYGIPLVQTVQGIGDVTPRSTVGEAYNFITSELEAALGLVDAEDRSVQYVNSATIHGLLARAYLFQKNYAGAIENATAVIEDPAFALLDGAAFPSVFSNRRTSESVFELAFDNQNRSDFNSLTYNRPEALRTEVFFFASPSLAAFFENRPGDVRATMQDYDPTNNDESITSDGSGRTQKYRGEDSKDNPAYMLRLAEMYLIRAEASSLSAGLDDLNALRTMRGMDAISPASEEEFQQAVFEERRAELNFEGHLLFDLARTGRAGEVLGEEFRAVLPVPGREVTATGGVVTQNPGY